MLKRILNSPKTINVLQFLGIFFVTSFVFYFLRKNYLPYYTDNNDSFYHVTMAKMLAQNNLLIKEFPYFQFSFLKDNFVDWHYLFHLILIPFIKLFGEVCGPKLLGTILVGGIFSIIFLILKNINLKFSFFYTLGLFAILPADFFVRMTYIRAPVLSLFLLVLALYFLVKQRPVLLAITIFFYVWAYYLMSFAIFIPIVAYLMIEILRGNKVDLKLLFWPLGGLMAGLIINPFFPDNLSFLLVLLQASTNERPYAGVELFSPEAWYWFYSSLMVIFLFAGGLIFALIKGLKLSWQTIVLVILAFFFLVLQWKSIRFYEYAPLIVGLAGTVLLASYFEETLLKIKSNWKKLETWVLIIFMAIYIQEGIFHGIWEYWTLDKKINNYGSQVIQIKESADYLNKNSSRGEIVFASWGLFPQLFYFGQKNYYIVGLDPVFLEIYRKDLLEKYIDITMNPESTLDLKIIKDEFQTKWVVVTPGQTSLKEKLLKRTDIFKLEFDAPYSVFRVL